MWVTKTSQEPSSQQHRLACLLALRAAHRLERRVDPQTRVDGGRQVDPRIQSHLSGTFTQQRMRVMFRRVASAP